MLNAVLIHKQLYLTLLFWMFAGMVSSTFAMVLIPVHILMLRQESRYILYYLGFWFILILSDSYQRPLSFATSVKPLIAISITLLILQQSYKYPNYRFYQPFILFFIIAAYCLLESPIVFESVQKMASYFLLLFTIPTVINYLLNNYKELFLKHLVTLITIILLSGIVLKYIRPEIVMFLGERYSGVFGNPNGMGMFGFLFFSLFTIIIHYYPFLFTKKETYFIYACIVVSLVWCGSRGGIIATVIFFLGGYLFKKSTLLGIITISCALIAYQLVISNFETIVRSLSLETYFRLETLKSGSGRNIAFDFAWSHIQNNFWIGKGIGYGEYLMHRPENIKLFEKMGHVGNVHNSYLTIWLDTGLLGLIFFVFGWLIHFFMAFKNSFYAGALFFGVLFSTNVESWLAASLNPFTIQLVTMLTLLTHPSFLNQRTDQ